MDFKRSLSVQEYDSWLNLLDSIRDVSLADNKADVVSWALDKSRTYTTKSLYRFLTNRGVSSRVAGYIWKSKVPLKIKFFLWQIFNKLQVAQSLSSRGWKGGVSAACVMALKLLNIFFFIVTWLLWFGILLGKFLGSILCLIL